MPKPLALAATILLLATTIVGCGGRVHRTRVAAGGARLHVKWPEGRAATNAFAQNIHNLRVNVRRGSTVVDSEDMVKPTPMQAFPALPPGDYIMEVFAHETTDESGPIIAGVGIPFTVKPSEMVDVMFSLTEPVEHIELTPTELTLKTRSTGTFIITGYGADGQFTLGDAKTLEFTSTAADVATAALPGVVTAGAVAGEANIGLLDHSTGKSAWLKVNVLPSDSFTVLPSRARMTRGQSLAFSVSSQGFAAPEVRWSVREPNGGAITDRGVYTAPLALGVYHVVATSASDPSVAAVATVRIGAGGIGVTIH